MSKNKIKILFLLLGDLVIFYFSLFLAIFLRYGLNYSQEITFNHFLNFSFVFLIWILIFSVSHLYELRYAANKRKFFELIFKLFLIAAGFSIVYFYIFTPNFTPKKILFLTLIFSFIFLTIWRVLFNQLAAISKEKLLIISDKQEAKEILDFLKKYPQLGYEPKIVSSTFETKIIIQAIQNEKINTLVIDSEISDDKLNNLLVSLPEINITTLVGFYENTIQRIPLNLLNHSWFLVNYYNKNWEIYESLKRIFDFIGGLVLLSISLPVWPIIALAVKLSSSGPVFYKSVRLGRKEKKFFIYKFRTMVKDAGKNGPAWTLKDDPRITKAGKFLRTTHLDELPQVLNIIKGDISFVGPRPEEEKLVALFKKEIPFYNFRFLIKPGVIGWAQINYPHGASVEDAKEKLKYDFYYLKNRNIYFDFLIALKSFRIPFEIPTH